MQPPQESPLAAVTAGATTIPLYARRTVRIGRDHSCDLATNDPVVSRHHAEIFADGAGRVVVRDLGSANGTYVQGQRIETFEVHGMSVIALGGPQGFPVTVRIHQPGPMTRPPAAPMPGAHPMGPQNMWSPRPTGPMAPHGFPQPPTVSQPAVSQTPVTPHMPMNQGTQSSIVSVWQQPSNPRLSSNDEVSIGRSSRNMINLDDPLVSRQHAILKREGDGYRVMDLSSLNGIQLNGESAPTGCFFGPNDRLGIGRTTLVIKNGRIVEEDRNESALSVQDIGFTLKGGKKLLRGVNFTVPVGSLTAVIGPSGAGKSTLLRAITGSQPATEGNVIYQGLDLYKNFASLRQRIGVVPQDDVVHRQLTVRQALLYAAELRLPSDYNREAREHEVDRVITSLGLTEHQQTRISAISGGQRKRTSVALELLTQPDLLLLDEPTSGLDPSLERGVMDLLRAQADSGRAIMVVTHTTDSLDRCDQVIILAPGGMVAFCGPPSQVLKYFGASTYADVYTQLNDNPEGCAQRFAAQAPAITQNVEETVGEVPKPPRQKASRQWSTLVRRHFRVIGADRSYAISTLILPIALAIMALAIPGSEGFGVPSTDNPGEPNQLLVILIVGAAFMGMSVTIRELIGERAIFLRERAVGLSPLIYLGAKTCVLFLICAVQTVLLMGVVRLFKPGPDEALWAPSGTLELAIAIFGTALVSGIIGLMLSALVSTGEQTMPVLVITVMAQLVLCGGVIEVTGRKAMETIAAIAPARWGYAQGAATVDLHNLNPLMADDALWEHTVDAWTTAATGLVVIGVVTWIITLVKLYRQRSTT